jgi:hypothetical protein
MVTFANHPHHPGNEAWGVGVVGIQGDEDVPFLTLLTDSKYSVAHGGTKPRVDMVPFDYHRQSSRS